MPDLTPAAPETLHAEAVPDASQFALQRAGWRRSMAADQGLRDQALELQIAADGHHYTYSWEWLGVPVIRLPDDIVVLQELIWQYRPQRVIETGVARGGSVILDASLMRLCGEDPAVLGIDINIFEHTHTALSNHPMAAGVTLLEADSTSPETVEAARAFLGDAERALLVLDSNHTHDHVLTELRLLAPLLPVGAMVLVADTLVEELPSGFYHNRPWDRGDNPATAARAFLAESSSFELEPEWSRRSLLSEFRDGVLRRIG